MFLFQRGNKKKSASKSRRSHSPSPMKPEKSLDKKLQWFQAQLERCQDVVFHSFSADHGIDCAVIYIAGLVDVELLQDNVLWQLTSPDFAQSRAEFIHNVLDLQKLAVPSCVILLDANDAVHNIMEGQVILLLNGEERMISFPFTYFGKREAAEAKNEVVIRGSHEAFVEDLNTNIPMVRRRIKSQALKLEHMQLGTYSHTAIAVLYMEGICKEELIAEVRQRLSRIEIDGVLESNYIEELIEDNPYSPFPQIQNTERPDTVCAALLEGRVAILTDGTPIALIAPVTITMLFQSAEDYYQRYYATTWIRWIRYFFILVAMLFPSFYIALTTYHPAMIPSSLLFSIAAAREPVPFPAIVEAFIMEITFEALREASIRIPSAIGQAVSILGTLVIGEAAVRAGIVSSPMVIIVSLTGISSFIVPSYSLGLTLRLLRFPIMLLAGSFGLVGLSISLFLILLHLVSLSSFGTPYLSPFTPIQYGDMKDTFVRAPWRFMTKRPAIVGKQASRRLRIRAMKQLREEEPE